MLNKLREDPRIVVGIAVATIVLAIVAIWRAIPRAPELASDSNVKAWQSSGRSAKGSTEPGLGPGANGVRPPNR